MAMIKKQRDVRSNNKNGFRLFRKISPVANSEINTCTTTTEKGSFSFKGIALGQRKSLTRKSVISKITDSNHDLLEQHEDDDDDITVGLEDMYTPSPKPHRIVTTTKDTASLPIAPHLLFPMDASLSLSSSTSTSTSSSSKISCRLSPRPKEFDNDEIFKSEELDSSSNSLARLFPPVSFVFVPQNFTHSDAFRRQSDTTLQHKRNSSYLQRPPPRMIGLSDWDDHSIESVYSFKDNDEGNNGPERQKMNQENNAEAVIAAMRPWINRRNAARLALLQNVNNNNNNNNNNELPIASQNHDEKFESTRLIEQQQDSKKQQHQQRQQQQQRQNEPKRVVKWHIVRIDMSS
jgi:hypothetical protein